MPDFEDVKIVDLPDFTGEDAAYADDPGIAQEALEAGIKADASKLPAPDNHKDHESVIDLNQKPPSLG